MPKWPPVLALLFANFLLSTTAPAQEKPMPSEDEKNVIVAVERMTAAFHAGDLDRVMASYEEDAVVMFEPGKPVSDPQGIREGFRGFFSLSPRFTYGGHEVNLLGDLAIHIAPWKMTGSTPDGAPVEQRGLSVAVLRKQTDGRWLLVIDNPHGQHLLAN
jgi:uncharacterized protein (TIGR02246 family)